MIDIGADLQRAYDEDYEQGKKDYGRPQGKWIFNPKDAIDSMFAKPKCSNCGFESADGRNFCPNCGAEMKGAIKCTK